MKNLLLLLLTLLLALQATSSDFTLKDEGRPSLGFGNYTRRRRELTSQDDLDGVHVLTSSFEQLSQYTGHPCAIFRWEWILCSDYPTRVAFLYGFLSAYGLSGNLPDFSKLDGLVSIYMSDNELNGSIPDFLGKLPHLTKLDLSNNNFSGDVPKSITSNRNLDYNVAGNPDLNPSQPSYKPKDESEPKNKKGLIVVLVIGIPLAIVFAVLGIAFIVYSRKSKKLQLQLQQQQQQTITGGHGISSIDIGSMSMSTEPIGRPSNYSDHLSAYGGNAPTAPVIYGSTNQTGAANANAAHQNTSDDEIAELLRQRSGQTGS